MKAQQYLVLAALLAISVTLSGCGFINEQSIDTFVDIKPTGMNAKWIKEYCGSAENLVMSNITTNIAWPGCGQIHSLVDFGFKEDGKGGNCPKDGCIRQDIMEEMDAFNKQYGGQRVYYKSRHGKGINGQDVESVELGGWWLPAPFATPSTPRIVVQHGMTSNSNKYRPMFIAYLLRKMGFSVLVNNLRDTCYSANSTAHIFGWGEAWPMDILGAWDYARNAAAGSIDASKVGILGISAGAFLTLDAFGMEGRVPGVWADGPPFTVKGAFVGGATKAFTDKGLGFFASLFLNSAWEAVQKAALARGIDITLHTPDKELPTGPDTKRPVFITSNKQDTSVPFPETEKAVNFLNTYPLKYTTEFWVRDDNCGGDVNHCIGMFTQREEYSTKLCKFWSGVFGTPSSTCSQVPAGNRLYDNDRSPFQATSSHWYEVFGFSLVSALAVGLGAFACCRQAQRASHKRPLDGDWDQSLDPEE